MTLFSAGKLLLCDFDCAHATFLVYNTTRSPCDDLAMPDFSNSLAFKIPRSLTTSKVMPKAC